MDDFAIAPGQPNAFGLVGAEANAVAPRKRPLSSMSPTIVLQQGQPILTLGAAGGPTIISQVLQTLVRTLDLQIPLPEAVAAPRIHHQWAPDSLRVENGLDEAIRQGLAARGHRLTPVARMGVCQAIFYDPHRREFLGVHDPRTAGKAAGP
jgi:gamma-glutamyltranspeptidase/glutathione hydrolase